MTESKFNLENKAIRSIVIDEKLKECRFILVMSGSKNPVEKEWSSKNNYSIDNPLLQKHISSGGNYGVMPSGTIAVLDVDEKDTFDRLRILDHLKETFIVKTGSDDERFHIYLKISDACPAKKIPLYDPKDNSKHIGEIFFTGCPAFVVGPGCTHPSGNKYLIINDAPLMEMTYNQIQEVILSKVHHKTFIQDDSSNQTTVIFPDTKVTMEGRTLSNALNLEVVKILHPDITRPLHKTGDEICGTHPVHGSTTGKNYCINTSKNLWYCHRCGSGGGPLEAVAVKYGLINCNKAGKVKIRGNLFNDVKNALIENEGYRDQIKELDADWKKQNRSRKGGNEEEQFQVLTYFEQGGNLYLTTVSDDQAYQFVHLDENRNYIFDKCITSPDGYTIYPRELPIHQDSRMVIPIVGIPNCNILEMNPVLDAISLFNLIMGHMSKYLDSAKHDLEMFAYYAMFTWFYVKCVTTPYLRFLGDTGKGKSRFLRVVSDLCFYPLSASGASSFAGLMRTHEKWRGTLRIDEADLRGGAENPIIKYLNLGFEKGQPYILCDKNDLSQGEYFDPFGPKIIAMRQPFIDVATEGRCISYSPYETERKDIPSELSREYFEQVEIIRAHLAAFTLHHWNQVDGEKMIDLSTFNVEPRLKQMIRPLSIMLQVFPDGEKRITEYLMKRQTEVKKTRSESWEGGIFNYALSLALGDEFAENAQFADYYKDNEILAVTASMISKPFNSSPKSITRTLHSIGFEIERDRIYTKYDTLKGKQVRKLVVPNEAKWREIVQRYYFDEGEPLPPSCPKVLRGKRYVESPAQRTLSVDINDETGLMRWDSTPSPKFEDSNLSLPTSVVITSGTLSTNSTEDFESEPLEYVGQTGKNSLIPYEQCTSIVPYKTVVPDHNGIRTFQSSYDWKEFYAVPIRVSAHSYTRLVKSDGKWCMVKGCTKTPEYGNQHGMYPLCSEHYRELKNLEMGELL